MDEINFFPDNLDVQNKKIILRLDLNVPLRDKIIQDDTRIVLCLPFIKRLVEKKAKIIIISHLGRPKGIKVPELSLIPIYKYLKKSLPTNVYFYMGNLDEDAQNKFSHLKEGEIILIENIRYFKEESNNDEDFAKRLGSLGDIYINDAFSCSHRKQASIHNITKFIKKSFAGPLLKKEINAINLVIQNKKEPVTCIIGGSKISTKINVISSLIEKVNNLVIVGAMANNFFIYKNLKIGKSLVEENTNEIIRTIYKKANKNKCKIIIPEDCMIGSSFTSDGINKDINTIEDNDIILDIGTKTIEVLKKTIALSKTVLWNGPAGYFENQNFANGSIKIAEKIIENNKSNKIYSVAGGGDTVSILNSLNSINDFNFVSTAGGAFLEYLEGKELPGIKALN